GGPAGSAMGGSRATRRHAPRGSGSSRCAALPGWWIGGRRRRRARRARSAGRWPRGPRTPGPRAATGGAAARGASRRRRLFITDPPRGGPHPRHPAARRYVITFNGEIYNYADIRRELAAAGRRMRSESDTEVLLEACALWGVEAAIERT